MKVVLFDNDSSTLRSSLIASYTDSGDLELAGQDLGKFVEMVMGTDEYEYWLTVPAAHLRQLAEELAKYLDEPMPQETELSSFILNGLRTLYANDKGFKFTTSSDFQDWLDKRGIPSETFSYS